MKNEALLSPEALATPRSSASKYAFRAFWILFVIGFLNYLDRSLLVGASNVVAHELGLGIDSIGFIASAFLIVYTVGTIPLGIWADRTKRKNVIAVSVTIWSIATALTAVSFNFLSLFLSRMILGIGEAGYLPAGTAMLSDYFHRERRSRIMSWWTVSQLLGVFLGIIIGGIVAGLYVGSWRLAFLFTGIPGISLAYLAWKMREPRRNEADEEAQATRAGTSELSFAGSLAPTPPKTAMLGQIRDLLRIKTIVVLTVMQMFALFVLSVAVVYLPIYLQQKDLFGLSSGAAGTFSGSVIILAGTIGTIGGGYLADALNRIHAGARVLVCGIGFLIGAPTFALAMTSRSLPAFAAYFIITTVFVTLYSGPSTAATVDVVPAALRASAVAITLLIAFAFGEAISPALVGVIAKHYDATGGSHFAQNVAGHDLSLAMLITCTPALAIAGLVGIIGARWMKGDVAAAAEADRLAFQTDVSASAISAEA